METPPFTETISHPLGEGAITLLKGRFGGGRKLTKPRRSYEDLIDAIIDVLPVYADTTIQAVARSIGSSWETADRWLRLIAYIQEQPQVKVSKSPYGRGYVYRRQRAKVERE